MRVAVVGGGIGGCAAAYFAWTMLQNSKVTIYEKQRLGGRILTCEIEGLKRELGATFFTSSNTVVTGLVKDLRLRTHDMGPLSSMGIWDGERFVFETRAGPLFAKLVSKYRLGLIHLTKVIEKIRKRIWKLYAEADDCPRDMRILLSKAGLNPWLERSLRNVLEGEKLGSDIIDEVVEPLTRLIYNQGAEICSFAGLAAIANISDNQLLKLEGGNISLPVKLADSSGATIRLGCQVKKIERSLDGSFQVVGEHFADEHDAVVLAAPIELLDIKLDDVVNVHTEARKFQSVFTKILKGDIDPRYFGLRSSEELPRFILTTSKASFCNLQTIRGKPAGQMLYSITSNKTLTENVLDKLFSNRETILEHTWEHAYPVFKPGMEIQPSILADGLYYLNSLETAVSSVESSSFAAWNAVRLLKAEN